MTPGRSRPVFHDASGRRWDRLRIGALALGIGVTLLFGLLAVSLVIPPLLPSLPLQLTPTDTAGTHPLTTGRGDRPPAPVISRHLERERLASRKRLFDYLRRNPVPPARRYSQMPTTRPRYRADSLLENRVDPIVAGFYVNWDDNSLASLRQHVDRLDWVVAEWGLLGRGTGPGGLLFQVDKRALAVVAQAKVPPEILLLITNTTGNDFDPRLVKRIVESPKVSRQVIDTIVQVLDRYNLAGVTLDFEQIPPNLHPAVLRFVRELHAELSKAGRIVTQALPGGDESWPIAKYAQANDRVFLMLYDEHDASDPPGPVASEGWFTQYLDRAMRLIGPKKLLVTVGQYGYHWTETADNAEALDFQEAMQLARDHDQLPTLDPVARNTRFAWSDPDSTDHIVWTLDAPAAYNELRLATERGVAGFGVWRLGAEDPSLWTVLSRAGVAPTPAGLDTIRVSYDVDFQGTGEILKMVAKPSLGRRTLETDASGLIRASQVEALPSTYVIRRYGRQEKTVSLTFDDGPDGDWTGPILDTLASRGVKATFFIIGQNAEIHPELLRRMYREGHEIGNHTFTHPNLALTGRLATRLELTASERLVEALLNRRSILFRAPYFGDAEPTTADELIPISQAQDLGYISVGLHIDPGDWATPGADSIVGRTLDQLNRGNIVLLHDGGGNRLQTVQALGPLIDSLKARGYSFATVSQLAGLTRDQAMVPLPKAGQLERFVELGSFSLAGGIELFLRWLFLIAVVLGIGRLAIIVSLALVQRLKRRLPIPADFHPSVSVIVPAYNEERVVVNTIESLLKQDWTGLEIVVVDDGSRDRTFEVAQEAFQANPAVRIFRKPNGGKASALNYGLGRATGEIVVALDADTIFEPDTVTNLLAPLADPDVAAVAGNAKVGNRINLVTRWQAIEYITSQNIDRRAFSLINGITVVPGAVGAWRRAQVLDAGGFSDATLAEDQDLTMTLLKRGWRVAYADHAIAWTEAPDTLRTLARQRFRWSFGTLQCAWKHREVLLRPRYGAFGMVAMPNIWIFQLLFPFISPVADLLFLWSLVSVWLNKIEHSAEYALTSLEQVVGFYLIFLAIDWAAAVIALRMEPEEDQWLAWLVLLQRFVYRQVMYLVVVKSVYSALKGRMVGWGKLERKATVTAP